MPAEQRPEAAIFAAFCGRATWPKPAVADLQEYGMVAAPDAVLRPHSSAVL